MSDSEVLAGGENPGNDAAGALVKDKSGCSNCCSLSKKLKVSREWNKFFELKLENMDKLLHIVADYEREKQHNVELQLAYDQRSRESSYIREQMANLLLEVEPLREKLRKAEKCVEEEKSRREKAENQEHVLLFTIEQQKHQIKNLKNKVDTKLIEILEKKLTSARNEIKRLKVDNDNSACENSRLKDFIGDRRLHNERNNKKTLWSLRLARKYGLLLHERGHLQGGLTSADWNRLQSLLGATESVLHAKFTAFLKKQKKLKKNNVEIASLPSLECWLNDFDEGQDGETDEDSDNEDIKIFKEKILAKEAKQLDQLILDIKEDEMTDEGKQDLQDHLHNNCLSSEDNAIRSPCTVKKDPFDVEKEQQKNAPMQGFSGTAKQEHTKVKVSYRKSKNKSHLPKRRGRNRKNQKNLQKMPSVLDSSEDEGINTKSALVQNSVHVHNKVGKPPESEPKPQNNDHLNNTKISSVSYETSCSNAKMKPNSENHVDDSSDIFTGFQEGNESKNNCQEEVLVEGKLEDRICKHLDSGEDIIRQILNDMKPPDKLDCLDNSFVIQDLEESPTYREIKKTEAVSIDLETKENIHYNDYDDILGPISDSDDEFCKEAPKKFTSQLSEGFSVMDSSQEQADSLLKDLGISDSDDRDDEETLEINKSSQLLQRFQSSQSFSLESDDTQNKSSAKSAASTTDNLTSEEINTRCKRSADVGNKDKCFRDFASIRVGTGFSNNVICDHVDNKQIDLELNVVSQDSQSDNDKIVPREISDTGQTFCKYNKPKLQDLRQLYTVVNDSAECDESDMVIVASQTKDTVEKKELQKLCPLNSFDATKAEKSESDDLTRTEDQVNECKKMDNARDRINEIKLAYQKLCSQNRQSQRRETDTNIRKNSHSSGKCQESTSIVSIETLVRNGSDHQESLTSRGKIHSCTQTVGDGRESNSDSVPLLNRGVIGSGDENAGIVGEEQESIEGTSIINEKQGSFKGADIESEEQESVDGANKFSEEQGNDERLNIVTAEEVICTVPSPGNGDIGIHIKDADSHKKNQGSIKGKTTSVKNEGDCTTVLDTEPLAASSSHAYHLVNNQSIEDQQQHMSPSSSSSQQELLLSSLISPLSHQQLLSPLSSSSSSQQQHLSSSPSSSPSSQQQLLSPSPSPSNQQQLLSPSVFSSSSHLQLLSSISSPKQEHPMSSSSIPTNPQHVLSCSSPSSQLPLLSPLSSSSSKHQQPLSSSSSSSESSTFFSEGDVSSLGNTLPISPANLNSAEVVVSKNTEDLCSEEKRHIPAINGGRTRTAYKVLTRSQSSSQDTHGKDVHIIQEESTDTGRVRQKRSSRIAGRPILMADGEKKQNAQSMKNNSKSAKQTAKSVKQNTETRQERPTVLSQLPFLKMESREYVQEQKDSLKSENRLKRGTSLNLESSNIMQERQVEPENNTEMEMQDRSLKIESVNSAYEKEIESHSSSSDEGAEKVCKNNTNGIINEHNQIKDSCAYVKHNSSDESLCSLEQKSCAANGYPDSEVQLMKVTDNKTVIATKRRNTETEYSSLLSKYDGAHTCDHTTKQPLCSDGEELLDNSIMSAENKLDCEFPASDFVNHTEDIVNDSLKKENLCLCGKRTQKRFVSKSVELDKNDELSPSETQDHSELSHIDTEGHDKPLCKNTEDCSEVSHTDSQDHDKPSHTDNQGHDKPSHTDSQGHDKTSHTDNQDQDKPSHTDSQGHNKPSHTDNQDQDKPSHTDSHDHDKPSYTDSQDHDKPSHTNTEGHSDPSHTDIESHIEPCHMDIQDHDEPVHTDTDDQEEPSKTGIEGDSKLLHVRTEAKHESGSEGDEVFCTRRCRSSTRIKAMQKKKLHNQEKMKQLFQTRRRISNEQSCMKVVDDTLNFGDSCPIVNNNEKEQKPVTVHEGRSQIHDVKGMADVLTVDTNEKLLESESENCGKKIPTRAFSNQPKKVVFNWGPQLQSFARAPVQNKIKFVWKGKLACISYPSKIQSNAMFVIEDRKRTRRIRKHSIAMEKNISKQDECYKEESVRDTPDIFDTAVEGENKSMKKNTDSRNIKRDADDGTGMERENRDSKTKRKSSNFKTLKRASKETICSLREHETQHSKKPRPILRSNTDKNLKLSSPSKTKRITRSRKASELHKPKSSSSQKSLFGNESSCLEDSSPVYEGQNVRNRTKKGLEEGMVSIGVRRMRLSEKLASVELSESTDCLWNENIAERSSSEMSSSSMDMCGRASFRPSNRKFSVRARVNCATDGKMLNKPKLDSSEDDIFTENSIEAKKCQVDSSVSDFSDSQENVKCKRVHKSCVVMSDSDDSEMESSNILPKKRKKQTYLKKLKESHRTISNFTSKTEKSSDLKRRRYWSQGVSIKEEHSKESSPPSERQSRYRCKQSSGESLDIASEPELSAVGGETSSEEELVTHKKCPRKKKTSVNMTNCDSKSGNVMLKKESAFEIASRLSETHMRIQERKRRAILLNSTPESKLKHQEKKNIAHLTVTPTKHEEIHSKTPKKIEVSQTPEVPACSQEKCKKLAVLPGFCSSDSEDSDGKLQIDNYSGTSSERALINKDSIPLKKDCNTNSSMPQKKDFDENFQATPKVIVEDCTKNNDESSTVLHPGLVGSLARIGSLGRPRVKSKPKPAVTAPPPRVHVPASSAFVDSLFARRNKDAELNVSIGSQSKDGNSKPTVGLSHQPCSPACSPLKSLPEEVKSNPRGRENVSQHEPKPFPITFGVPPPGYPVGNVIPPPNLYGSLHVAHPQRQNTYGISNEVPDTSDSLCQRDSREEEHSAAAPLQKTLPAHQNLGVTSNLSKLHVVQDRPSQEPKILANSVTALGIKAQEVQQTAEVKGERHCSPQIRSLTSHDLQTSKAVPHQYGEECNYLDIFVELCDCRIRSKQWFTLISRLCSSITTNQLLCLIRNFIECILRADPLEHREMTTGLPPSMYKLFQVVCIVEIRLDLPPFYLRNMLKGVIHDLICNSSVSLRPRSLACLSAWYTATVSIPDESGVQQWQPARALLMDLLFHHPGVVHLALLSAASVNRKLFIRIVNYRVTTGLEKVVVWVAYHGVWLGCSSVREKLVEWLTQHCGIHKPPPSNPTQLASNLLTQLSGTFDKTLAINLVTSIIILARWLGEKWVQEQLLPAVASVTIKYTRENGQPTATDQNDDGCTEELDKDISAEITLILGHLEKVLKTSVENSTVGDQKREGNAVVKLGEALLQLLKFKPKTPATKS